MKDKLGTTHVADTASWLTLIYFPLLPNKILILFRVAMCPARKLHFPASLATMHDHMTPFWPMRHKWKSIWNLEESSLIKMATQPTYTCSPLTCLLLLPWMRQMTQEVRSHLETQVTSLRTTYSGLLNPGPSWGQRASNPALTASPDFLVCGKARASLT